MYKIIETENQDYIFFPYTLAIFPYDEKVKVAMQCNRNNDLKSDDDLEYIKSKIDEVIKQEEENKSLVKMKEAELRNSVKITGLQINIAYACNMKCKYCFAGDGNHYKSGYLTNHKADCIIDYISQNCSDKVFIQIVGGEPLINVDGFKYLVTNLKKRLGERVHFSTTINGLLVNTDILNFFKKYKIDYMVSLDSHIKWINDSLRVSNNGESAYEKIMNDFIKYKDEYDYNCFHITVTPNNLNVSETIETLFNMGAKHISVDFVKSLEKQFRFSEKDMEVIKEECRKVEELILDRIRNKLCVSVHPLLTRIGRLHYRKPLLKRCGVNNNLFACAPDGAIYPCDMLMWEDYKLGDIAKGIDSARHKQIINKMVNDKCEDCWARLVCGGMCFADTTQYSEEMGALCELRKIFLESHLRWYIRIREEALEFDFDKYL